jgi:hypothetical protein
VPAPVEYDDGEIGGMMIGRGTEVLGENLPQCYFVQIYSSAPTSQKPQFKFLSSSLIFIVVYKHFLFHDF